MGDQNCHVIPESSLSLRLADASLYHPEASKGGVLGGEGNVQCSPRGRGAHPAISAFLHAPFAFRHPTFCQPHPLLQHAGNAHLCKHPVQLLQRQSYGQQLGLTSSFL